MAGIELRGVTRVFPDGSKGVDRLDLVVREGEFLVLIGPSGSGKTTTLRLIAGLDEAKAGTIWIGGREVTKVSPRERNVAMVFQGLGLYEHLSVEQNMAFGLRMRQSWWNRVRGQGSGIKSHEEIRSKVGEVARLLGIEQLLTRRPGDLSGGEQQRVALGRALVRSPAALLLDEPLSSLDPPLRSELRQELKELQRRLGVTTIYVTHDQSEAMVLGERIAVIRGGRIEQVGTPDEIYLEPKNMFVAGFFGEGGMNWVRDQESGVRSQESVLGVRPEDVKLIRGKEGDEDGLKGTVTGVQWLGAHSMVEVELGGTEKVSWSCRVCGRADFRPGEKVAIHLANEKKHWFEAATGERRTRE